MKGNPMKWERFSIYSPYPAIPRSFANQSCSLSLIGLPWNLK
jgi:hypothetical protein